eukprot:jgi/Botrbrau1/7749/Bobra.0159s0178.1
MATPDPKLQGQAPPPAGFAPAPGGFPQGFPQGGYPPQGFPQGGYPPQGFQQGGYPPQGYPQGFQQQGAPGGMPGAFPTPGQFMPHPNIDIEAQQAANFVAGFAEQKVRQQFMAKVLTIVGLQLAFTAGCAFVFYFVEPLKTYVRVNPWPFYVSWGLSFAMIIALSCSESLRRKYPMNVIFLGLFTVVFGFQIGVITSFWNTQAVMIAFLVTCGVVGLCAFIAFFTKLDLTKFGGFLAIAGFAFIIVIFIGIFWIRNNWVILVVGIIGAVLFSVYLIYDLQLMMGGKTVSISPDEYVFASISIYLDVINIFLMILQIVGAVQNT